MNSRMKVVMIELLKIVFRNTKYKIDSSKPINFDLINTDNVKICNYPISGLYNTFLEKEKLLIYFDSVLKKLLKDFKLEIYKNLKTKKLSFVFHDFNELIEISQEDIEKSNFDIIKFKKSI